MRLTITADDYGYGPGYDRGIVEAANASAIDAVSVMVLRGELDPEPLKESGVEVGLHLELGRASIRSQVATFEGIFGREPTHVDGHHHCHMRGRPAVELANLARERGWRVRSVDERHRRLLRCKGVPTADLLVGRMSAEDPPVPAEIEALERGSGGVGETRPDREWIEWVVHPGHADPSTGSSLDAEREEDLRILLELARRPALRRARGLRT